ncbi:MAG: glycosyltransferase [Geodermatophilaceae bacterium]|nr:glycosyltransferase [Geodermatophilaceae bacterium]
MRILQLHNDHQSLGGAPEVMAHEAALLTGAGHVVEQYRVAPAETLGLSAVRSATKSIWNVEVTREVAAKITSFRPDVAHVHTPFPLMSPAVFRTAKRLGVPTVTTLHSYRWSCVAATCFRDGHVCEDCVGKTLKLPGIRHRCYHGSLGASAALTGSLLLHRTIGTQQHKVDRWISLTGFGKRLLERDGLPADKIVVKPNSMPDPGEPTGPAAEPYVAIAARLVDVKGIETLLRAWPQVTPGLTLKIAGDGALRGAVEAAAAAYPTIEYLGWLGEAEVGALMAGARAMIVPSEWYEGLPLVVLRSLSYGTPLVVSDLENICEDIVGDDTGVAFATGDAAALAAALSGIVTAPQVWADRRAVARQSYLDRYTPEVDLARLEQIYRDVTAPAA